MYDGRYRGHDPREHMQEQLTDQNKVRGIGAPNPPRKTSGSAEMTGAPEPGGTHPGGPGTPPSLPDKETEAMTELFPCENERQAPSS